MDTLEQVQERLKLDEEPLHAGQPQPDPPQPTRGVLVVTDLPEEGEDHERHPDLVQLGRVYRNHLAELGEVHQQLGAGDVVRDTANEDSFEALLGRSTGGSLTHFRFNKVMKNGFSAFIEIYCHI